MTYRIKGTAVSLRHRSTRLLNNVIREASLFPPWADGVFARHTGNIKAMNSSEPVITMDLYPTLLELAGCRQLPEQTLDGQSLVPLIRGDKQSLGRPFLAWWYPHSNGHGTHPCQAILQEGWDVFRVRSSEDTTRPRMVG